MSIETAPRQKTSWELLKEQSHTWWDNARQNKKTTRFGHPNELAEHVIFGIIDFFIEHSERPESDEQILALKKDTAMGRYEDVINKGEEFYKEKFLSKNPDAEKSLVVSLFNSAVAVPSVA